MRPLLQIIALIWLMLSVVVPASASTVHQAAHGLVQVSAGTHHHHGAGGEISVHEQQDSDAPDGGHEHMPSTFLCIIASVSLADPAPGACLYGLGAVERLECRAGDSLQRPPRLG